MIRTEICCGLPGILTAVLLCQFLVSVAANPLTAGEIIGIAIGVLVVASAIGIAVLCLRKKSGYKQAVSAPVTYRKGSNLRTDRAPLTTRDKDPSPPPATLEDQFFIENDSNRRLKTVSNGRVLKNKRQDQEDAASSDVETTLARDGGDDDYFYDEIFGKSDFTDEKTSAAIKELSSPKPDDEWPDLIFDDDPFS
ncbi:uncharacterized protein LOC135479448 isoform X2 [Liolophura sinensis]|uniref:uncharacterized protein LOC135479448 isoform X2 n=1 Tax=Liolophura sinensis TaxID=3198878 RepID=UPI003158687B